MSDGAQLAARLRDGDLAAAPAVLNLVENRTEAARSEGAALLHGVAPAELGGEARAHVIGITGPPGAGKSTLLSELVRAWRARDRTVAVLAVDPSSKRSGGSLLGDRARIDYDPQDRGVFIRSTAAGGRLGGLAPGTRAGGSAGWLRARVRPRRRWRRPSTSWSSRPSAWASRRPRWPRWPTPSRS